MDSVLGSLGIIQGSPQQTRIVTPYADGMKAFSAFLGTATSKIRVMIYGATLQVFFDDMIKAKNAGIDVKAIFDYAQSRGHSERPEIDRLVQAGWKDGVDFLIGTSPEDHQIIHIKSTIIDDRWVEDGSLNYSVSAFKQINTISLSDWPEYAEYLTNIFDQQWQWILQNEMKYNQLQSTP